MNEQSLLELLKKASEQLMEMWRVADDSVADYTLEIETAVNFINRALDTEDRLDIFRALQKSHDVLEKEYDETPSDEEYDNLVDRLRAALGGLNENVYMKKLKVKKIITEAVLGFLNEGPYGQDSYEVPKTGKLTSTKFVPKDDEELKMKLKHDYNVEHPAQKYRDIRAWEKEAPEREREEEEREEELDALAAKEKDALAAKKRIDAINAAVRAAYTAQERELRRRNKERFHGWNPGSVGYDEVDEGKLNKVDAVNIPSNTDDAEEPVGDIVPSELTEEEKKKMWFDKLKKRVKHKN